MSYLKVGTIISSFGLKGQVKVFLSTSFVELRFKQGATLFIKNNDTLTSLTVSFFLLKKDCAIVGFKEIKAIEETTPLLKKELLVLKDQTVLKEEEFFYSDLVSLEVIYNNQKIGHVIAVEEILGQTNLRIELLNKKSFLLPYLSVFISMTDLKEHLIIVQNIEGFF